MADDQKFSKEVQVQQQRSIDQVEKQDTGKAASAFDRARSGQTQQQQPARVDSQQVRNAAPGMNGPNPPANAKNAMARESHSKDMAKDNEAAKLARARELDKAIKEKQQKQPERDHQKDHER